MDPDLYQAQDALGLAQLVAGGECSPEELLDEAIRRADASAERLRAIVLRLDDQARDQLSALPAGRLRGVPFLLKDAHPALAGTRLTHGSRLFGDHVPMHDSHLTGRYRRAGLVLFGRTASPELALTTTTESRLFGVTPNPWSPGHTAGGSSGGAAAAVAGGVVPAAHASDGGGSIRIPASCCHLFGLKPSRGLVSFAPDRGEGWSGLSTHHAITRTVRDSAALLDAAAGPAAGEPWAVPLPDQPFLDSLQRPPAALRIALTTVAFNGVPTHGACADAAEQAAELCRELGHEVVESRPEIDERALARAARNLVAANVAATIDARCAERGSPPDEDDLEPVTVTMARIGRELTALDHLEALETLHATGRALGRFFERHDLLLTPTMPAPPQPLGALALDHPDPAQYGENLRRTLGFTQLFNASGGAAMSVPFSFTDDGLPVGVQFAGPLGCDALLLRLAASIETARPWAHQRPGT